ncbi:3-oxoacyl-(acyl carrier protein) synthase ii [Stylonychia lemnae]|uniref:beta-ketoacyl-[acyl-carrier-protein] synthase I n=1 Tax=Stylonychia lemnae TaxID=5949 RepID=A0A077ZRV4_STYLE|nr:3-oxoacyl-(acyl carrier protein) synthase ii [Stylonychia lemnae]|eukprot:CDW72602.1 3-oxoacyl-(acyl carrier protein) synthase ii [Stylonychia lemnae]
MNQSHLPKRVVVTGLGMVSPIGVNVKESWANLLLGKSGIVSVKGDPEFKGLKSQIGGRLPAHFDIKKYQTSFGDARIFSLANAVTLEAIEDAKLNFDQVNRTRVGVVLGNQFGVLENYNKPNDKLRLLKTMNHMVPSLIAINHQLKGPVSAASTASSSGGVAIGESFKLIRESYSDIIITGGMDYNLNRHFFEGMELFGANCNTFNDHPEQASRPFDTKRAGPIMSDGGGALILESLDSALSRNANIYCEIVGYSQNTDAFHILRPTDDGEGLFLAIQNALVQAGITPSQIDLINSHATSTPAGDLSETKCHQKLLGNQTIWSNLKNLTESNYLELIKQTDLDTNNMKRATITAHKSNIGHTFCAAGALESIFGILSIRDQVAPRIINLENPLTDSLSFAQENVERQIDVVVKTCLAFGGVNSALVFKSFKEQQSPKL